MVDPVSILVVWLVGCFSVWLKHEVKQRIRKPKHGIAPGESVLHDGGGKEKKNGKKKKNGDGGCGCGERKTNKDAIDKPKEKLEQKKSNELVQPQLATAILKVHYPCLCYGCREKIKKEVTKTIGYRQMAIDGANGRVTVNGSMDMNALAKSLERQLKRYVEIVQLKRYVEIVPLPLPLSPQKEDEKKEKSGYDHKEKDGGFKEEKSKKKEGEKKNKDEQNKSKKNNKDDGRNKDDKKKNGGAGEENRNREAKDKPKKNPEDKNSKKKENRGGREGNKKKEAKDEPKEEPQVKKFKEEKSKNKEGEKKNKDEQNKSKKTNKDDGRNKDIKQKITMIPKQGFDCVECASKVMKYIRGLEGVESVNGDNWDQKRLTVIGKVDPIKLQEMVEQKTHKKFTLSCDICPLPEKEKDDNKEKGGAGEENRNRNKEAKDKPKENPGEKNSKTPVTTAVLKALGGFTDVIFQQVVEFVFDALLN